MTHSAKRLRRAAIAWSVLILLGLTLFLLGWKGAIWFNMPSRKKYPVRGVDVSHYQGDIDFSLIAKQGISFVFIKATEGSGTADERFAANWDNARAAGLLTGAYHFYSFESAAETQADNFLRTVPYAEDALPPVIDLEYYRGSDASYPETDTVRRNLGTLLTRFREAYGKTPVIYTTSSCYADYLEGADLGEDYLLWIRSVLTPPDDTLNWTFWQYNPRGLLKGYSGDERFIDLNAFRGALADLQALGS